MTHTDFTVSKSRAFGLSGTYEGELFFQVERHGCRIELFARVKTLGSRRALPHILESEFMRKKVGKVWNDPVFVGGVRIR